MTKLRRLKLITCIVFILFFATVIYPYASSLKNGEFILNINKEQKVDLIAKQVEISKILEGISKQTGVEIKIKDKPAKKLITVSIKDEPLSKVLKRIIGNNYILSFRKTDNGFKVSKGKILDIKDRIKEFIGSFSIDESGRIKIFFTPPEDSPESIADYIKERHKLLDYLAETYPNKKINTQISFKNFLPAYKMLKIINGYNVKAKIINHGWGEHSGGFEINSNQSIKKNIKILERCEEGFINSMYASKKSLEETKKLIDPEDLSIEEEKGLQYWEEYTKSFQEKGVMVYGLEIEGTTQELKEIKDTVKEVRLIDPLWKGNFIDLLEKTNIISPVAIPISPYFNPVSQLE